jgi:dTDP-4-dehydrorhamnose 3,5-epimerase
VKIVTTDIPGPLIIEPKVFGDDRGFFMETWNAATYAAAGLDLTFVQDNHSHSQKGVLRGLHYQLRRPQGKLVRVTSGKVFDVAVDVRRSSPHFGRWVGVELSADNHRMLYVPPGFAHGFLTLTDGVDFQYKCTEFYDPSDERGISWFDPDIAIAWPDVGMPTIRSAKDETAPRLRDAEVFA